MNLRIVLFMALLAFGYARNPSIHKYSAKQHVRDQDHRNVMGHTSTSQRHTTAATEDSAFWQQQMQAELQEQLAKTPIVKQAKNIIFFLGDGTSISTLTAARLLKGHMTGNGEHEVMAYEKFPYVSLIKTFSNDKVVTDSAASATAYLNGVKGNQGTIGVDANVPRGSCDAMNNPDYHTTSILRDFQDVGKATGVVTTTTVTHASPAGCYAHTGEREWESDLDVELDGQESSVCDDIAEQLVFGDTGSNINVVMGGGRSRFTPVDVLDPEEGVGGDRQDGKDLIATWIAMNEGRGNTSYVWNREALLNVDTANTDYLMGLFDPSHMAWAIDEDPSNPSLEEMTRAAIEVLQRNDKGFFLFVEGGLIDKAHHRNEHRSALSEALEFEKAIAAAAAMTDPQDTLIVVTADHSQPFVINGYPERGSDVRGLGDVSDIDGLPFTTLLYTNGPGYRGEPHGARPDPSLEDYTAPHYAADSTVPMDSSHHAGEEVFLYARGPHAHLFQGLHENAFIPHALRYAACVGNGLHFCDAQ